MSSVICEDETETLGSQQLGNTPNELSRSISSELPPRAGKTTKPASRLESAASRKKKDKSPRLKGKSELVISCCIPHAEASFNSCAKYFIKHTTLWDSVLR